jgi:hypothetical protein
MLAESEYPRCVKAHSNDSVMLRRANIPLVPAFAITHYKAQGQSYTVCIVDLLPPKTQHRDETWFSWYVMLSRLRTRKGLYILRPFLPKKIKTKQDLAVFARELTPPKDLLEDHERLMRIAAETDNRYDMQVICL